MASTTTRLSIYAFLITAIVLFHVAQQCAFAKSRAPLSIADRTAIMRSVLRRELRRHPTGEPVVLWADQDVKSGLGLVDAFKLTWMASEEMIAKRETDVGVSFYFFGPFEHRGRKVIVNFGKGYQSRRSNSGSGTTYVYRRISGRWIGKATSGFGYCAAPPEEKEPTKN